MNEYSHTQDPGNPLPTDAPPAVRITHPLGELPTTLGAARSPASGQQPRTPRRGFAGILVAGVLMLGMLLGGAGAEAVSLVAGTNTTAPVLTVAPGAATSAAHPISTT